MPDSEHFSQLQISRAKRFREILDRLLASDFEALNAKHPEVPLVKDFVVFSSQILSVSRNLSALLAEGCDPKDIEELSVYLENIESAKTNIEPMSVGSINNYKMQVENQCNSVLKDQREIRQALRNCVVLPLLLPKDFKVPDGVNAAHASEKMAKDAAERIRDLANALEERVKDAAIGKEAIAFADAAKRHRNFYFSLLAAIITWVFLMLWFTMRHVEVALLAIPEWASLGDVARRSIPFVMVYAVGYFALVALFRAWAAERHNWIVNRHRAHALTVFRVFAEGTANPVIKEAILLQATNAVFAPQPSGFIRDEPTPQDGISILKIASNLAGSKTPSS